MITQAELNMVLVEINKILEKINKRLDALEKTTAKPVAVTKTTTRKAS
mgnify:CR=1 FL=1